MRKQLLLIVLIIISFAKSYSQISFEDGYFIDESNNRIECLIKNMDWRNNPTEFEYMLHSDDTVHKATIEYVMEFGVNNVSKFIRARTFVDRSPEQLAKMSTDRDPDFREELIFLKVLIEGQASLYIYIDGNMTRFFYKFYDSEIEQLVYKKYLIDNKVAENNQYKQQLAFLRLKCDEIAINDIERIGYSNRELTRLFVKYNECISYSYINYRAKQKKSLFNLTLKPGLNFSSFNLKSAYHNIRASDFGNRNEIRLGIEAEFIMPFNNNKWSLFIEPTYQRFTSNLQKHNMATGHLIAKVHYESIELPISLRHYFFINENSKILTNVAVVNDINLNSEISILREDGSTFSAFKPNASSLNYALGVGYKYRDRYSLEMRYNTNRNILRHINWWTEYRIISLVFGYSFF